jgi:hypothetical protein
MLLSVGVVREFGIGLESELMFGLENSFWFLL